MAITYWTGGNTLDPAQFLAADNWSGNAPAAGDTAIINATSIDIKAATTGFELAALKIGPNFTGSLGKVEGLDGTAESLVTDCIDVDINSPADIRLKGDVSGKFIINDSKGQIKIDGTIDELLVMGGRPEVTISAASASIVDFKMISCPGGEVTITNGSIGPNIKLDSGTLTLGVDCAANTVVDLVGGLLELTATNITTLNVWAGGSVEDKRTVASTITNTNVYDGKYDGSEVTAPTVTFTNLTLYEGAKWDERCGTQAHVYTNGINIEGASTYLPDTGRVISES